MTRRGLREVLPALAFHYGILPWHIDPDPPVLTHGELEVFSAHYMRLVGEVTDG